MKNNYKKKINHYYNFSKFGYNLMLDGSKHFGYYNKDTKSEKEAQLNMSKKVAEEMGLDKLDNNKIKVLEIGCGQGLVSNFLAKKYSIQIDGITIVPFEVEYCRKRAEKYGVRNLTNYSVMDFNDLKYKDNTFDIIYCTEVLTHSTNMIKTLSEIYRVLKKGGKIVFFEYSILPESFFTKHELKMFNAVKEGCCMFGLRDFEEGKFTSLLKKVGFNNLSSLDITKNTYPSLKKMQRLFFLVYIVFIKPFGTQVRNPNVTCAVEFPSMIEKGKIKYIIYKGEK